MASVAMGLSRRASKARPHCEASRLRITIHTRASRARQSQKNRGGVSACPKTGGRLRLRPWAPPVRLSSSFRAVVLRAAKLRVARAN